MKKRLLIFITGGFILLISCRNEGTPSDLSISDIDTSRSQLVERSPIVNTGKSSDEAYNMLHVVFEGEPDINVIKKLMKAVLDKYGLEENYEILNRTGSALLTLRQSSAVGVTEMEILKHMYQLGDAKKTFPNQAAISATILEQYK